MTASYNSHNIVFRIGKKYINVEGYGHKYRTSIKRVLEEIELLEKTGYYSLFMSDIVYGYGYSLINIKNEIKKISLKNKLKD